MCFDHRSLVEQRDFFSGAARYENHLFPIPSPHSGQYFPDRLLEIPASPEMSKSANTSTGFVGLPRHHQLSPTTHFDGHDRGLDAERREMPAHPPLHIPALHQTSSEVCRLILPIPASRSPSACMLIHSIPWCLHWFQTVLLSSSAVRVLLGPSGRCFVSTNSVENICANSCQQQTPTDKTTARNGVWRGLSLRLGRQRSTAL